jgi:hypothetical protein
MKNAIRLTIALIIFLFIVLFFSEATAQVGYSGTQQKTHQWIDESWSSMTTSAITGQYMVIFEENFKNITVRINASEYKYFVIRDEVREDHEIIFYCQEMTGELINIVVNTEDQKEHVRIIFGSGEDALMIKIKITNAWGNDD